MTEGVALSIVCTAGEDGVGITFGDIGVALGFDAGGNVEDAPLHLCDGRKVAGSSRVKWRFLQLERRLRGQRRGWSDRREHCLDALLLNFGDSADFAEVRGLGVSA